MTVQINIAQLEDQVLNPLNNIMLLSYGSDVYKDVEKEIRQELELDLALNSLYRRNSNRFAISSGIGASNSM